MGTTDTIHIPPLLSTRDFIWPKAAIFTALQIS